MQIAQSYVKDATNYVGQALNRMPLVNAGTVRSLPVTMQEISRYVEQLLTPEEQRICDMATD